MTIPSSTRVLLVDDDPGVLRDYGKLLQRRGFAVEMAADGQHAISHLADASFDVIVTDLSMPRMGGLEFLRAVRLRDLDIPVLLMTGDPNLSSAVAAIRYGAFRYLTKPVDIELLSALIRRASNTHRIVKLKREALAVIGTEGKQLGDRASLEVYFESAMERLWMAYQPIVDWPSRTIYGYEALLRSDEPAMKSPADILDAAERLGRVHELGRRIRLLVAASVEQAPEGAHLFVNLHASDLEDAELLSAESPLSKHASRVVLEITERASLIGVPDLDSRTVQLRALGYRLAIDDLGAGYAGLSSFSQLEPEFVKLDMALIRGLNTAPRKRSVVQAMIRLCKDDLQIGVVSEGVETVGERDALAADGATLMQGYLFAKPDRGFPTVTW